MPVTIILMKPAKTSANWQDEGESWAVPSCRALASPINTFKALLSSFLFNHYAFWQLKDSPKTDSYLLG